jgi:hypothetical protein
VGSGITIIEFIKNNTKLIMVFLFNFYYLIICVIIPFSNSISNGISEVIKFKSPIKRFPKRSITIEVYSLSLNKRTRILEWKLV